jgi:hypothetical protein
MFVSHLIVFTCSLLADALYGGYTISLARGNMLGAVSSSTMFSIIRTGMTVMCVHDWNLVPAAVLGEAVGTVCVILVDRRAHRPQPAIA